MHISLRPVCQVDALDFGPYDELYPLKGKCFSKKINQYEYEVGAKAGV